MLIQNALVVLFLVGCLADEPGSSNEINTMPPISNEDQDAITRCRALNPDALFSFGHETNHGCSLSCYTVGSNSSYSIHNKVDLTPCRGNQNASCFSGQCYENDPRESSIAGCRNATQNQEAVAVRSVGLLQFPLLQGLDLVPDCSVLCYSPSANSPRQLQAALIREGEECTSLVILSALRVCKAGECVFQMPTQNEDHPISKCRALHPNTGLTFSFGHEPPHGCSLTCFVIGTLSPYSTHNSPDLTECRDNPNGKCFSGLCYEADNRTESITACRNSTSDNNAIAMRNVGLMDLYLVPDCSTSCYAPSANTELKVTPIREGENCTSVLILSTLRVCNSGECRFRSMNPFERNNNQ